jgi:hypothetical protein
MGISVKIRSELGLYPILGISSCVGMSISGACSVEGFNRVEGEALACSSVGFGFEGLEGF